PARIDLDFPELYRVLAVRNHFVHGFAAVEAAVLIHVAKLHGVTDLNRAGIGLVFPDDHPEQGGFPGAVGTDDADDPTLGEIKADVFIEQLVTEALGHGLGLYDDIPQTRARRNVDFQVFGALLLLLRHQFFVAVQPGFPLRLTGLRRHPDPFQL